MSFTYNGLPSRVIFGQGTLSRVAKEVEALGCHRVLVLSTPGQEGRAREVLSQLGHLGAEVFAGARMHTPVKTTEEAMYVLASLDADGVVAIGGGSTIGLGKAIALRTDLPQIAIPTTYAGSEMTPILGETKDGIKTTQRTVKVLPETVIYDVNLTLGLPIGMSGISGINAIAHAVEALYAKDRNPIVSWMAEEGIAALARSLPKIAATPTDVAARADALYGAWLCGACLGAVEMSLHHKLCHTLGGSFDLPHAETHAVVLPHVVAYNAEAAPEAMMRIARALVANDAAGGLYDLAKALGAPLTLRDIGLKEKDIDRAMAIATANPYWNPRKIEANGIRRLLNNAYTGLRPKAMEYIDR
jgi:alcohol dehydrogenase class IV